MNGKENGETYICPMHPDVRQRNPGRCPKCRMDLVPEGARFAILRHMIKRPLVIIVMVVIMVAAMIIMLS